MNLLIDCQAFQSNTRNRGIGRYARNLLKGMALNGALGDFTLHINTTLTGHDDPMLKEILEIEPDVKVVAAKYQEMLGTNRDGNREKNTRILAEIAENFDGILSLDPMEAGLSDFTPNSKASFKKNIWFGVVVYDLIPMLMPKEYLASKESALAYHRKLQFLRSCDGFFSISDCTKNALQKILGINARDIFNISGSIEPFWKKDTADLAITKKKFGVSRDYIFFVGGNDYRKNILGMIDAYALLPRVLRDGMQLVIGCELQKWREDEAKRRASEKGLDGNEVIFTGFVPDDTLRTLYSGAKLFVFPSLYEGLGFPVLEAIKCGAPVLAGYNSSMPEVVGSKARECLFDAASPSSIAAKIRHALENPGWTKHILELQQKNAESFTLENRADYAVAAVRESFERFSQKKLYLPDTHRPKIAIFTPLPPAKSGISNYNARLIPHMLKYFEIDAVIDDGYEADDPDIAANCGIMSVEEFERKQSKEPYEMLVFHICDSPFHTYMLPMLIRYGGVAVIHDVYLNHLIVSIDEKLDGGMRNLALFLRYSEDEIKYFESHAKNDDISIAAESRIQLLLSCIVTCAYGVLVHSEHAKSLLENFYIDYDLPVQISRHGALYFGKADEFQRERVRKKFGVEDGKIVCAAMGMVHPIKEIDLIVDTLIESENRDKTVLVLGGEGDENWVGGMTKKAEGNGLRLIYTGYLRRDEYCECISMLDFAFALRGTTRGETSGALLEIMGYGAPAIVYDIGSFSEIPDDAVYKIPQGNKEALLKSIDRLATDKELRDNISSGAIEYIKQLAFPRQAEEYALIVSEAIKYKERIRRGIVNA